MANLIKVARMNGEVYYVNLEATNLAFFNPKEKTVKLNGPGFEKLFRVEECPDILTRLDSMAGVEPEVTPEEAPAPEQPAVQEEVVQEGEIPPEQQIPPQV